MSHRLDLFWPAVLVVYLIGVIGAVVAGIFSPWILLSTFGGAIPGAWLGWRAGGAGGGKRPGART